MNDPRTNRIKLMNEACRQGDIDTLKELLKQPFPSNKFDENGTTPLHVAASKGNIALINILLQHLHADVLDRSGNTPIICAVENNKPTSVKFLLANGANVNKFNSTNKTSALHIAIEKKYDEIFDILLNNGASLNCIDVNGNCPLMIALQKGHRDMFITLLKEGANFNNVYKKYATAVHSIVKDNDIEIVRLISRINVNILDEEGNTPLHIACYNNNIEIIEILLKNKPDFSIENYNGRSAFDIIMDSKFYNLYYVFLQNGAQITHSLDEVINMYNTSLNFSYFAKTTAKKSKKFDYLSLINSNKPLPVTINTKNYENEIKKLKEQMPKEYLNNMNEQILIRAILEGNNEKVKYICSELKPNVNFCDEIKGDTPLIYAIKNNNLSVVHTLILFDADVNAANVQGDSPLNTAVYKRNKKIISALFKENCDPNITDSKGNFPLKTAIFCNFEDIFYILLKNDADINQTDNFNASILHTSIYKKNTKFISIVCKAGVDVNIKNKKGLTALHYAVKENFLDAVKIILEYNPNLNINDNKGFTPLHTASFEGKEEIFKVLIAHGANINLKSSTPKKEYNFCDTALAEMYQNYKENKIYDKSFSEIHIASYEGDIKKLKKYIKEDTDLNAKTIFGCTPLHLGVKQNHFNVVNLLIKKAADLNSETDYFYTPLFEAVQNNNKDIIQCLLINGANLNYKTSKGLTVFNIIKNEDICQFLLNSDFSNSDFKDCNPGFTSLHSAAFKGNLTLIKLLLDKGVNVDILSSEHSTPLHRAIKNNQTSAVEMLLQNGADLNIEYKNKFTPLNEAAYYGHLDIIPILVKFGADVNKLSSLDITPLQTAARCSGEAVLELLIDLGADIDGANSKGRSALYYAATAKRDDIVEYLFLKGAKKCCRKKQNAEDCVGCHMQYDH